MVLKGRVVSHYRLLDEIDREGERATYRARDLTLEREVAIEVLPPGAGDSDARERFRREARITSLISHPHIRAVHDSGEEDGILFVVYELLDGEPLGRMVAGRRLPAEELLALGSQIADALLAVHARGLVHGSLSPSSVFVTSAGHVKLLDVGWMSAWWENAGEPAALDGSSPTASVERRAPAEAVGEIFHAYQSPEQVAGERLDHRSDIFSAGALMYRMATGSDPFTGDRPADVAAAIVRGDHVPVRRSNPQVPESLAAVIERALATHPASRYQTVSDLLDAIRRARRRLETVEEETPAAPEPRRRRMPVGRTIAIAGVLLAAGGAALVVAPGLPLRWSSTTPEPRHEILVGGIANGTNDPDFDETLRQALLVHLGQSPYLDIVPDERLRQILQMMGRPVEAPLTHDVAWEACQRLGLAAMLEGSVSAVGRATSVALVATDCATGETIAREQAEVERKEAVLRAVGTLASSVRTSLGESVASLERHNVSIEEATTPSLDALKAYTAGAARRAEGYEVDAIPFFERAISLDPKFALAYTTLSSIYGGLGETGRSEEYARLAYEHRGNVSERERLFIAYQYHDRVTGDQNRAREALEVWKQSYSRDYRPANALAVLLNRIGDYDRAIVEAEEAIQRNPAHSFPYSNLAYAYRGAGRYEDSRKVGETAVSLGIETVPTRRLLYQLAELAGDEEAANRHFEWGQTRPRAFDLIGARAQVLAFRGRMREARTLYAQTVEMARARGFAQVATGYMAQAALGEAMYGFRAEALRQAREVPRDTTYAPKLRAAVALALAGSVTEADGIAAQYRSIRPDDTLLHGAYRATAEAALLLARGRPGAAIEALRPAAAVERGLVAALLPICIRAAARLESGAFEEAAADFRLLLELRGVDPFSPAVPVARLGLARALGRLGDTAAARAAYLELLQTWAGADADLPLLQQARTELADLK